MWDLNVSDPDHCLSFYFSLFYHRDQFDFYVVAMVTPKTGNLIRMENPLGKCGLIDEVHLKRCGCLIWTWGIHNHRHSMSYVPHVYAMFYLVSFWY